MFCTKCGQENPNNSRFCHSCGTPLGDAPVGGAPQPQAPRSVYAAKKKNKLPVILLIAGLAVLLLAGMFIGKNLLFGASSNSLKAKSVSKQFVNLVDKYGLTLSEKGEHVEGFMSCEGKVWTADGEDGWIQYFEFDDKMRVSDEQTAEFQECIGLNPKEKERYGAEVKEKAGNGSYYLRTEEEYRVSVLAYDSNRIVLAFIKVNPYDPNQGEEILKILDQLGY